MAQQSVCISVLTKDSYNVSLLPVMSYIFMITDDWIFFFEDWIYDAYTYIV